MNQPGYFEIQANDVKRAVQFYGQIFGWKFTKVEGLPIEYFTITTEGSRGGLLQRPAPTPPHLLAGIFPGSRGKYVRDI